MSADLFAEFNNLSSSAPPPQQQQPSVANPAGHSQFSFGTSSNNNSITKSQSPVEQWPSFQEQSNNMGGWNIGKAEVQSAPAIGASNDEDDGWGDFEVAEQDTTAPSKSTTQPNQGTWNQPSNPVEPRIRIVRAPTIDLMTNTLVDVGRQPDTNHELELESSWRRPQHKPKPQAGPASKDPNVLFDVDDFELQEADDDFEDAEDFGDFETVKSDPSLPRSSSAVAADSIATLDLLSLDEPPQQNLNQNSQTQVKAQPFATLSFGSASLKPPPTPKQTSFQNRNPFPELVVATKKDSTKEVGLIAKSVSPVSAWPTLDRSAKSTAKGNGCDEWAAWDDNVKTEIDNIDPPDNWNWESNDTISPAGPESKDNQPPPTNVPPPSVILSSFPDLLSSGNSLFKSMSGQNASIKQQILSNPKATKFLQGYILLATTAARVMAGRKHRWHRDKILAKSMSISASGSKGMKLAGIDKTQAAREDREAADVVSVWREHVGRIRSAVAAANATGKTNLKVPELSQNLQIQVAKMVPTAPKPCIICGLKREERVGKVDYDVEDSFGEWWVDHWGHRACRNFWIEHEKNLRQR